MKRINQLWASSWSSLSQEPGCSSREYHSLFCHAHASSLFLFLRKCPITGICLSYIYVTTLMYYQFYQTKDASTYMFAQASFYGNTGIIPLIYFRPTLLYYPHANYMLILFLPLDLTQRAWMFYRLCLFFQMPICTWAGFL